VKFVVNGSQRDYRIVVIVVEVSSHFTCPEFTLGYPKFTVGLEVSETFLPLHALAM